MFVVFAFTSILACKSNRSHLKRASDFGSSPTHITPHHLQDWSGSQNPNWINIFNRYCNLNVSAIENTEWKDTHLGWTYSQTPPKKERQMHPNKFCATVKNIYLAYSFLLWTFIGCEVSLMISLLVAELQLIILCNSWKLFIFLIMRDFLLSLGFLSCLNASKLFFFKFFSLLSKKENKIVTFLFLPILNRSQKSLFPRENQKFS